MNTNTTNYELKLLYIDQLATSLFLVATIISIILTNDEINVLKNKKTLFNKKETYDINLYNRLFIICILFTYFFINYQNLQIGKIKNKNLKPFQLQLIASTLIITASFIILYSLSLNNKDNISQFENPNF